MDESRPQIDPEDEAGSGEPLDGSGFEAETPVDLDQPEPQGEDAGDAGEEAAHG